MDENYDVKYEKYDKAVQLSEERSEGEWTFNRNEVLMSGLACVARGRRKKGMERGREKSTKEGKGKGASPFPSLPYPPPFSPFSLSPYPFRHLLRRL